MTPPVEPMTYDDLSRVCRSEQRLKNLVEVRIDLYPAIRECRERLRSEYEREYAIDPFSTKTKLASKALTEFTDMVELTYETRMKKILAMALRASEGNKIETTKLTREEKELFDTISGLMKDRHASLIDGKAGRPAEAEAPAVQVPVVEPRKESPPAPPAPLPISVPAAVPPVPATAAPVPEPAVVKPPAAVQQKAPDVPPAIVAATPAPADKTSPTGHVVLRILEDIPPFAASDRNYSLKKEDLVSLPPAVAKALIARKKAVGVQISEARL